MPAMIASLAQMNDDLTNFSDQPSRPSVTRLMAAAEPMQHRFAYVGADLGIPGYGHIKLVGKVIYGSAWLDMDKSNIDKYNF